MGHLVLAGGGHVHVAVLSSLREFLDRGHRVTLVSPVDRHYYSGMGPGLLAGTYTAEETRFDLRAKTAGGAAFVKDAVEGIDPAARVLRLASGDSLGYDVVSFNIGSRVAVPRLLGAEQERPPVLAVKPIDNLLEARNRLRFLPGGRVAILGGGPASVELAGAVWRAGREFGTQPRIVILTGRFLEGRPARVVALARKSLERRGVEIVTGVRVAAVEPGGVGLEGGRHVPAQLVLSATGVRPAQLFGAAGLAGPSGGLLVDGFLRHPDHPEIHGAGDCIHFGPRPLDKVGVFAVRQAPVLAKNLLAALEGAAPMPFSPQASYLLILNTGDDRGILWRGPLVTDGRAAFLLKDWLDRSFMARFR